MEKLTEKIAKYVEKADYLTFGIVYIILGLLLIIFNNNFLKSFVTILLTIMIIAFVKDAISLLKKNSSKNLIRKSIFNVVLVGIALFFENLSMIFVVWIFAIYFIFNGITNLFSYIVLKLGKISGGKQKLFSGIFMSIIGVIILFSPNIHMKHLLIFLGIYSILLGLNYVTDGLEKNLNIVFSKMHIRIPLPVIIDFIIPFSIMKQLDNNKIENNSDINQQHDLEIFVHVSEKNFGKFGHVDLCFNGQIISYGNYDKNSRKLNEMIGSGVVFKASRNKYIKFCVEEMNKTLFVFGLKLTKDQKQAIKNELDNIFNNLIPWDPEYVSKSKKRKKLNSFEKKEFTYRLYKHTKAKFYKFKSGKMRAYFVLGNNCGTLPDKILRKSKTSVLKMYGIITPGTYYDYLEREYKKKSSNVVSKIIYNMDNIDQLQNKK